MRMQERLPWLLVFFLTLSGAAADKPNILLIVSEDNGPELGCYGDPFVKTPVLDALAQGGVRFDRAFVPQAGCSQSRAALLTGLYPHQNGQIGLATWKFRMYREDTPNVVELLKEAGYRTGIVGKLHVNPEEAFPFDFKAIPSGNFKRNDLSAYAAEAEKFIGAGEEPFFLSVNYPDAHRPFLQQVEGLPRAPLSGKDVKPLAYFGVDTPELRQEMADYYNCMSRLDTLVGNLLDGLRESGKYDNTLIVYLGDHGADLLRGKRTSYEGGVRIPMIAVWGNRWAESGSRSELVSTLDLMPTFLDVAGVAPLMSLSGRSLIPLLDGKEPDWREYLFTEFHLHSAHNFYPQRTIRDDRYKLIWNLLPNEVNPGADYTLNRFFPGLKSIIESEPEPVPSAYERMRKPPQFELYDLESDPYEWVNLADDPANASVLNRLRERLAAWREETNDPLLKAGNLSRLKAEVEACFENGEPQKAKLSLHYPDYFFDEEK